MRYNIRALILSVILSGFSLGLTAQRKAVNGVYGGIVKVKLSSTTAEQLNSRVFNSSSATTFGVNQLDTELRSANVSRIERLVPYSYKHEAKLAASGMNRWYVIYYEQDLSPESLASTLSKVTEVEKTSLELESSAYSVNSNTSSIMNDPRARDQWHYDNLGLNGGRIGADVKLSKAHLIETGKPNVIVSVHDFGVEYNHLDLAQNMWVNQAEWNGIPGVDDDGNGYVDDIYGYNFAASSPTITPGEHGTHCAGTVAAVNNNGIGVIGVAGGNGLPNSGVRIMSTQTFATNSSAAGRHALAFIYAANNGAVIAQNSWGYTTPGGYEAETLEAIDYFIDYAGHYPGSPMKGGLVVFASGNSSMSGQFYPGCYDRVISVSSTNNKDEASYYTNYDSWVTLSAPGGETSVNSDPRGVLSTVLNHGYNYLQGTSMACPHVSGVAALIVSKFGHEGYTPDQVKQRLINSTDTLEYLLPKYRGKMGVGRLNAWIALSDPQGKSPEKATLSVVSSSQDAVTLKWNVVADAGGAYVNNYQLLYSKEPFTGDNLTNIETVNIRTTKELNQETTHLINKLMSNGKYYFRLKAIDLFGNSSISEMITAETEAGPEMAIFHDEQTYQLTYPNLTNSSSINISNSGIGELRWESSIQKVVGASLKNLILPQTALSSFEVSDNTLEVKEVKPYDVGIGNIGGDDVLYTDSIWYDPDRRGDKRIGISTPGAIYTIGKRFVVNQERGFILSHIKYTFSRDGATLPLIFEVYRDGVYPNSGELVSEFMYYGGGATPEDHYIELPAPVKFNQNENFWVVIYHPSGMKTPSLINEPEYIADYDYVSGDAGNSWSEISIAYGKPAMFKIRALQGTTMRHISLSPDYGRIAPGITEKINVDIDATRLVNGTHNANIYIMSNDASNQSYEIPVKINVTGQLPNPTLSHNIVEFAGVSVGATLSKEITVSNSGYGAWNVSEVRVTNSDYRVNSEPFILQPGEQKSLRIDFVPTVEDNNSNATLQFISSETNLEARLIGYGRSASKLSTKDLLINSNITQSSVVEAEVKLTNEGKNTLIYSIPKLTSGGAITTEVGNYSWEGSSMTNARPYRFEDISQSGTNVPFINSKDDASAMDMAIGFDFPFYDKIHSTLNVNYNGFINFGTMPSSTHVNRALPSKDAPKSGIFGMWGDIVSASSIKYRANEECFIVQWTDAKFYRSTIKATFQIALFPSGIVEIRYQEITPESGEEIYTIGIQDETGNVGVGVIHKSAYASSQSMTTLYPYTCNAVSSVDKREGVIEPNSSETIVVKLDASIDKLTNGEHLSDLLILTNDPVNAAFHLPIKLNVEGEGKMNISTANIDFENTLTDVTYEFGLLVQNLGNKAINVKPKARNSAITFGDYTNSGIDIEPYSSASIPVLFTPTLLGEFTSEVTLESNDHVNSKHTIAVSSIVTEAPKIELSTSSLDIVVEAGKVYETVFIVSNRANTSNLDYTISTPEWMEVIDPQPSGGGVDSDYGYRWRDNKGDNSTSVGYSWVDIRNGSQELTMDMTSFNASFELPFSFPFYGKEQSNIYISGFGAIAFSEKDAASMNISQIPAKDNNNGLIIPLYSAMLQPSLAQSRYYVKSEENRVIIQFQNIQTKVGGSVTFQVHLHKDGRINYYYHQVENFMYLSQAMVGLEDYNGEKALLISSNKSYLCNNLAIEFYPPRHGSLDANGSKSWRLKVSAEDKFEMSDSDHILIRSNDPKALITEIPLTMNVVGKVELEYPSSADLGYVFVAQDQNNQPVAQPFEVIIKNNGTKKAVIKSVQLKNLHQNLISSISTASPSTINEKQEMAIEFTLAAKGAAPMTNGELHIEFEGMESIIILLQSKTTLPPVSETSKQFITWQGVMSDEHAPISFNLSNKGVSTNGKLEYSIYSRYLSGPRVETKENSLFLNRSQTKQQQLTMYNGVAEDMVYGNSSDLIFQDSLLYDLPGFPDDYLGFGAGDFVCANKFTVSEKSFRLTHAYNYYYTGYTMNGTVSVVKGGTNPDNGTLLVETPFTIQKSGEVIVPLPEAISFEVGESFWIVFSVKNAPNSQGVNINSVMTDVSFYTNGETWYELTKDSGLSTRPVFKIRGYSIAEEWLEITPMSGTINALQSEEIQVAFKRLSLPKAKSYAELLISTNDPLNREITIPVSAIFNERPQFVETPSQVNRIYEGELHNYRIVASDIDGDEVSYGTKGSLPEGFSLNVVSGVATLSVNAVHGTAGIYTVTVTAQDGINTPAEFPIVFEIIKINRAPETNIDEILPIRINGTQLVLELNDYFSDADGDELLYGHQIEQGEPFTVERLQSRLTITGTNIGEGSFTIFCSDGKRSISKLIPVIVDLISGLEDKMSQEVNIYPNPAVESTSISWSENLDVDRLEIVTIDGKMISNIRVNSFDNSTNVDISRLTSGYYVVRLISGDTIVAHKQLIKQ
ncbi:MAG: S8 family serine peptidase [Bacteroidales bacterium]